jgi:hypothetical protein
MSMDHKAFAFDWNAFATELAHLLEIGLRDDDSDALGAFVDAHRAACRNPYTGDALEADWRDALESADVQEVADFALAKYYDPADDHGLAGSWMALSERLSTAQQNALLGELFGPATRRFDPGRQGSFFQTPARVRESLRALSALDEAEMGSFLALLVDAQERGLGVYTTF